MSFEFVLFVAAVVDAGIAYKYVIEKCTYLRDAY